MTVIVILVWWGIIGLWCHFANVINYDAHIAPLKNPNKKALAAFLCGPWSWTLYLAEWLRKP